jgi:hypothetical protein
MIHVKDHHTDWLFDPWEHLGPKRRKLLEESWAVIFRNFLLTKLPVGRIAGHFDEGRGRPTKEHFTMLGALILQQLHDMSDADV